MSQEMNYDVVVVGAGHNGLTAGAYLSRAGAKVLVVERRHETGGALVTEEFSGYRFNLHANYMMMLDVAPPFKDLGLGEDGCVYLRPEAQAALLRKDGSAITIYADLARTVADIAAYSEHDAKRFEQIYLEYKEIAEEYLIPATYGRPVGSAELAANYMKSEVGRRVLEISEKTPAEICESWGFETPGLGALLLYIICMWGIDPEETNASYLVPLYFNRLLNATLVRGGSHRLSSTLQKAGVIAGMSVLESHEVKRFIVENGAVTGVEAAPTGTDGPITRIKARAVVTSTDPTTTFGTFMPEADVAKASKQCLNTARNWEWEQSSLFLCHLALRRRPEPMAFPKGAGPKSAFINVFGVETPQDVVRHIREVMQDGALHDIGHFTLTSDIDPAMAPIDIDPDGAVCRIEACVPYQPADGDWPAQSRAYGDRLIARLADYVTGLDESAIVRRYDYTPKDIEAKIPQMKRGSFKHGAYVMTQMGYSRPNVQCSSYKTPIENLYVCGASTFPGGMITFGGGYNVSKVVAEALGLDIWWREPDSVATAREKGLLL
ncbi:MAG: NAD(P)/FAD-dependent oxidoreductase [Hyphomonadaceae bacterium]|nr:NAD(P)/FAD-dependent oxidoreductase [Hyphomonadaceae bacterium]GIK50148.1 MAG: beta-carotene ketolase [Alphaproteobacteria bacterium]